MFLGCWFYFVLDECFTRQFKFKLYKNIGCFRLIILELGFFYMFMMICCFISSFSMQVCLVMIIWVVEPKRV